jgi:ubiquinone/menaquinone biosynthesis C-methylase UbiE
MTTRATTSSTPSTSPATLRFELHVGRGPFNAAFFKLMGPYIESKMRAQKSRVFADLPKEVVELGSGVGANLFYLPWHSKLIAIEPNVHMHDGLRRAAEGSGVFVDIRTRMAEHTGLADNSADAVISSLVLCSVQDVDAVLTEVRRVLRPGGTFRFAEHVVAPAGTVTRFLQRLLRRPWAWTFEGCSCERDLESAIRGAGFASVEVERYRIRSPFVPFNVHVAGVARA